MHTYAQARLSHERLAAGLGWFSLALGTAELAAPRAMARLIGIPDDPRLVNVVRAFGAREIASGLGLLAQPDRAGWAWSRLAATPSISPSSARPPTRTRQPPAGGPGCRGRRRRHRPRSHLRAWLAGGARSGAAPPAGTSRTRSASSGRSPSRGPSRRCLPSGGATRTCRDSCVT